MVGEFIKFRVQERQSMQIEKIRQMVCADKIVWTDHLRKSIVLGDDGENIRIITAYIPDETKFDSNFKVRRKK